MALTILVYEIEKDEYGEGKNDERYCNEFSKMGEVLKWLEVKENKRTTQQNIDQAIRKRYLVFGRYFIYKVDLDE